jgi:hypothetical protein
VEELVGWAILAGIGGCVTAVAAVVNRIRRKNASHEARKALARPALVAAHPEGNSVRVSGTVRLRAFWVEAPLSARRCVAYRARIMMSLGEFRDQSECVPFTLVRTDGSHVEIDSAYALIDIPPQPLPPGSEDRCRDFAIARAIASGDRWRATYEEAVVTEGMLVSVTGLLMKDGTAPSNVERGFRDDAFGLRLVGDEQHPIAIGEP